MRLAVYCDGSLVVTKPSGVGESIVNNFIKQKEDWILSKLEYFRQFKGSIFRNDHANYLKYKGDAFNFINKKVNHFNKVYNLKFNKINIKNQKTRWGSCSKKGNLNFNYKILLLPKNTSDYIIVHEMCHLKEFNHSQKFWKLVAKAIPSYSEIKKELRHKRLNFY